MNDFLEFDNEKKTVKLINLEDFSVEDLLEYIKELNLEVERTKIELKNKQKYQEEANKLFK